METLVIYGLLIPFVGTSLGSACVFFLKKGLGDRVQRGLTGFASGASGVQFGGDGAALRYF